MAASSRRTRNVREYDCVICGQSSASTAERPFGLVVLLQATSVLSHQHTRTEPLQLPVDEESSQQLRSRLRHNRAAFVDSRHDRLASTFENVSVSHGPGGSGAGELSARPFLHGGDRFSGLFVVACAICNLQLMMSLFSQQ